MITVNDFQLIILISNFFWPLVRILSFFSVVPIFNNKLFNKKSKIILSLMVSFLISPFLPETRITLFSYLGFLLLFQQMLIGIFLGFIVQLLITAINLSGEIIGLQMGLSFAVFFNNSYIGTSVVSRFFNILILFFFLSLNVHLYFISVLIDSFYAMPINSYILNVNVFYALLMFSSHIFIDSISFILPIMIVLSTINSIMSILNRLSPQISIFSIGFPINLLSGITILYFLIPVSFSFFEKLLHEFTGFISQLYIVT